MKTAKGLHAQSSQATQSGDFLQGLLYADEAMILYQQENNNTGFSEIHAQKFIIYKHLYEKTQDKKYLILAVNSAKLAVELAEETKSKEAEGHAFLNYGKALEIQEKYAEAATLYQKALTAFTDHPQKQFDKSAIRADVKAHLSYAQYKSGKKEAYTQMQEAIKELETASDVPNFEKNVWLSGAHLRTAEMLYADNANQALEHLQKAKEIINSDDQLTLRKAQAEKLEEKLKSM